MLAIYMLQLLVTLYTSELQSLPYDNNHDTAMLAILAGATLSITGFSVGSVVAQMTGDNTTMSGNMTGGNVTGDNTTGSISSLDELTHITQNPSVKHEYEWPKYPKSPD